MSKVKLYIVLDEEIDSKDNLAQLVKTVLESGEETPKKSKGKSSKTTKAKVVSATEDEDEEGENEEYTIEKVIDKRKAIDGKTEYLLKWKGYRLVRKVIQFFFISLMLKNILGGV